MSDAEELAKAMADSAEASKNLKHACETLRDALKEDQPIGSGGNVAQIVMAPPDSGERAIHRVEKYFVAMVVLNLCMGAMLILNWITDTNQSHVINAIYMMAPGLQEQIETKKVSP